MYTGLQGAITLQGNLGYCSPGQKKWKSKFYKYGSITVCFLYISLYVFYKTNISWLRKFAKLFNVTFLISQK